MKHLISFFLVMLVCSGATFAQSAGEDSIISNDSLLMVYPGSFDIQGVVQGTCRTVHFEALNFGDEELNISALYLDDASGTDDFELINPAQVPFILDTAKTFNIRIDYCPDDKGEDFSTLVIEYGDGKVLEIDLSGSAATIFDMDWCDDFSDWTAGEWIGNGWIGSVPANSSVYPSSTQGWGGTLDASMALFLRNREVIDDVRVPIEVVTPGVRVVGDDPVISWMEMAYSNFNGAETNASPRNLYISTDGVNWEMVDSYLSSEMPDPVVDPDDWFRKQTYSLKDYVGETIWWKFELISNNNEYIYWVIDNVCVQQRITVPILKHSPKDVNLGGVQVDASASQTISFTNVGVSVAKIKKIEIINPDGFWTLLDSNNYPVEIHDGDWAFTYNGTDKLDVEVMFEPKDIGVSTAQLEVTWGLYQDKIYTVELSGEGLSCATATEAFVGENWAAGQNIWFTYTAEKFQIVNINTCHPFNTVDPYEYSFDTYMYIYDDCGGNLVAENDDLEWDACPYNRASSGASIVMYEGETIKIFFPWVFDSASDDVGFYMNIEPSYPIDGDVCETAIPLTLPVVNHFGTTVGFADDYDMSPCSPFSNYMDGNDKVYSISLEYDSYIQGEILGIYGSIHVLDKCPVEELEKRNCLAFASGPNGGSFDKKIPAGTYYLIISTWAPPQTVDYLLNIYKYGNSIDEEQLKTSVNIYPNPADTRFSVSINNSEAKDLTLELADITGKIIYRKDVFSVYSHTEDIEVGEFDSGVYFLRVSDGEEVVVEKVVVR